MIFLSKNIAEILNAEWRGAVAEDEIDHISIDSRSMQNGAATLFFALTGPNNDGHDFIAELAAKGVKNFVVTHVPEGIAANFLIVRNTTAALQNFAIYYRSLFHFPIIGITGSNGKTIVKEWLNFLLSPDFIIIRSPKSYNSQVGVPLSVIAINEKHNLGIFEAGISTTGEMQNLAAIIRPTIGILTNIGTAHDEGFSSIGEKISEKLTLFSDVEVLIYNFSRTIEAFLSPGINTFSWSFEDEGADVFISKKLQIDKTVLIITQKKRTFEIKVPFHDDASVENAIQCIMTMLYLQYEPDQIESRVALLYPVEMRLRVKMGINNTTIIDDSYSSDFQSLKIALDFLESQKQHKKKTLILSDIFQSGLTNDELYSRVAQLIIANKISRVIAIGDTISQHKSRFVNCTSFHSTADFVEAFETLHFAEETIFVKGARHYKFEQIVTLLEEKTHETVLEINLNAISHNLNVFRSRLNPNTKLMVMVKAFGYGNGGFEIAKLLEHHNVDYLGVAFADEGISLKTSGIKIPIMVLNPEATSFSAIIQYALEPEIYSIKGLQSFIKIAVQKKLRHYPVHIKLDTGMHRLGFQKEQMQELAAILKATDAVEVKSVLSHLASSDDLSDADFTHSQIKLFDDLSQQLAKTLQIQPLRHILNTSGVTNYPEAQFDMVRLGIGLYGGANSDKMQQDLQIVGTLKSIISQVREIPAGDSVGYSRRFVAEIDSRIATIPIGYADGIPRSWGNGVGYVTVNAQKAPIVGSICMDMLMIDVTGLNCKEGDRVVIFGEDPTVDFMADKLGTIAYEILTGISQRVKRVFYRE